MGDLHWDAEALRRQLAPLCPDIEVEVVARTGSTNTDLLERVRSAAASAAAADVGDAGTRRESAAAADARGAGTAPERADNEGAAMLASSGANPAASRATRAGAVQAAGAARADAGTLPRSPAEADASAGVQIRRSVESRAFGSAAPAPPWRPCLRVAEAQTAGRGRQGRPWLAERGASLTFSLAAPLGAAHWSGLSLAVGVALAEAIEPPLAGRAPRIALKWPNDLWLLDAAGPGRKLGGVLIETVPLGARRIAVVGVGLNVRPIGGAADAASSAASNAASSGTTGAASRATAAAVGGWASLDEIDADASAPALLGRVAAPLLEALRRFEAEGLAPFLAGYARRDLLAGRAVRTTPPDAIDGVAEGVGADGCLLVRLADGTLRRVASGEVSVRLRPPASAAGTAA